MSAISGFCEKCNGFRKRYCDGDRNTCMSILFDTIESLQLENEKLKKTVDRYATAARLNATKIENFEGQEYGIEKESGDVI